MTQLQPKEDFIKAHPQYFAQQFLKDEQPRSMGILSIPDAPVAPEPPKQDFATHPLGDDYCAVKELIEHVWATSIKQAEEIKSLKQALESKMKNEDFGTNRGTMRANFDLSWSRVFGTDFLPCAKQAFRESLGL